MSETPEEKPKERRRSVDREMLEALTRVESEIVGLRSDVQARPTRTEVTGKRRLTVFGVVCLIFFVMQIGDQHTEVCGPGHRSEAVVTLIDEAISAGKPINPGDISDTIRSSTPGRVCGFTFPMHTHDGSDWPQPQHVLGLVFYALLFGAMGLWVQSGYNETRHINRKRNSDGSDHTPESDGPAVEDDVGGEGSTSA